MAITPKRTVTLKRTTKETEVSVTASLDAGPVEISTTIPFLDHMLTAFGRYAGMSLAVKAHGDLEHHISEDVAIVVGTVIARLAPPTAIRYGERTIPMDDALVQAAVDMGGRSYYVGDLPSQRYTHWLRSFADNANATIHVRVIRGEDKHHMIEAAFKAVGLAFRAALADGGAVFSTKGSAEWEMTEC